jgi:hypothetical protein
LAVTHSILTFNELYNLQDFPLLFVIIFLTFPHQQVMASETFHAGVMQAKSGQTTFASTNAPSGETQQDCRHQLVHCDAAIVVTKNMTLDTHLKLLRKTVSSNIKK